MPAELDMSTWISISFVFPRWMSTDSIDRAEIEWMSWFPRSYDRLTGPLVMSHPAHDDQMGVVHGHPEARDGVEGQLVAAQNQLEDPEPVRGHDPRMDGPV